MSKLDDIKIFSKKDTETVYQLNRKLLLKVVQCEGYCEVYYFVLKKRLSMPTSGNYEFIAKTVSNNLLDIFDEIDKLKIMSLQDFSIRHQGIGGTRARMSFNDMILGDNEIKTHCLLLKMFDKQTDVEGCIFSGNPYVHVNLGDKNDVSVRMSIYKPLSLHALVEQLT